MEGVVGWWRKPSPAAGPTRKSLAGRETLAAEDLLCMEGATVKLRSVPAQSSKPRTREGRRRLAPALLTFHAKAADLLESEDTGNDRLRAHLGRVDQVLPFLGNLSRSTLGCQGRQGITTLAIGLHADQKEILIAYPHLSYSE